MSTGLLPVIAYRDCIVDSGNIDLLAIGAAASPDGLAEAHAHNREVRYQRYRAEVSRVRRVRKRQRAIDHEAWIAARAALERP